MNKPTSGIADQNMPEARKQSFLSSYASSPANQEQSNEDEYRAFSFGRVGSRSQAMLTFIKKDDYVEAIAYAKLDRVYSSNTELEIKLDFGDRHVFIQGENLTDLFNYVCANRCTEINEMTTETAMVTKTPIVTKIEIRN